MFDFSSRADEAELMDDLSRPRVDFDRAYDELATINRRLGGIRSIERFLPPDQALRILDVAAGGCDVGEMLAGTRGRTVVSLDINPYGLRRAKQTLPVGADGGALPFPDDAFDVVMSSLFFHHLSNEECIRVLREMWRTARRLLIVNDLHRHPVACFAIWALSRLFSRSMMVQHDGPVSVRRAFKPADLAEIAARAGIPARIHRCFPYRLVLVARK